VLQEAQAELVNYKQNGLSVMEMSHRSAAYEAIHFEAIDLVRELLAVPEQYEILFLQGGASLQFSMVPQNFLRQGKPAQFILTGSWSELRSRAPGMMMLISLAITVAVIAPAGT
jgi:phosphoserine aminotransferase